MTAGPGGGPHLRVFDGAALQAGQLVELVGLFAYDPGLRAGMFVAGGTPTPPGGGGQNNSAGGVVAVVGGGQNNAAVGTAATVGGGSSNTADNDYAVVGGGSGNVAQGLNATVGGGLINLAQFPGATVSGGQGNTASGSGATVGGGASNLAGSEWATVGGGEGNVASGGWATVAGGQNNAASAQHATVPGGQGASATLVGQMAYASGPFAVTGDAQSSLFVLRNTTTDATPTELMLDGSLARLAVGPGRTMTFDVLVAARSTANQSAGYQIRGVIENVSGTAALIGAPAITTLGEAVASWDVTVVATGGALAVRVTGAAATTIRWVASVRTAEVAQ